MGRVRLISNISGGISKSNIAKVGLGTSVNMFQETQDLNEHSCQLMMRSAYGEVLACEIPGKCRGMYRVSRGIDNKPTLYAVYDQTLWLIDSGNQKHEIGRIDSFTTEVRMTETGGYGSAHPHLIIVDGTSVYAVNTGLTVGEQSADLKTIDLPLRVNSKTEKISPTHCAYLYGYLIVNDAGTDAFYTSYQYPFEIADSEPESFYEDRSQFIEWWMSLTDQQKEEYKSGQIYDLHYREWKEFIDGTADDTPESNDLFRVGTVQFAKYGFVTYSEWSPDNTNSLVSNGKYLYTLGDRSYQVFSYNDDNNNPFTSPNTAAGNIGCRAPFSVASIGESVLWLGSSDIGENGIFLANGLDVKRVSTRDIERELKEMKNGQNAYSSAWQESQHVFYSITFESSQKTFVYDLTEDAWHYRASYDKKNKLTYWRYNHATFAYGRVYVGTSGAAAYMDENKFSEHDDRPILKMRRGSVLTSDDCPFYIDSAELIVNNGQSSFGDLQPEIDLEVNPRVQIRYSWDGSTWSDYEDYYLGKIGRYDYSTTIWQLGLGRFFTLEISTTEKIPFCIQNLKIDFDPCVSFI